MTNLVFDQSIHVIAKLVAAQAEHDASGGLVVEAKRVG